MRIALAIWKGRISPVFDVTRQIQILDIENGNIVNRDDESLPGTEPQVQVERLAEFKPHVLICGAISQLLASMVAARNIRIIAFTAGEAEQVINAWLKGTLPNPSLSMPGCCGRPRGWRGHGHRRHGGRICITEETNGRGRFL